MSVTVEAKIGLKDIVDMLIHEHEESINKEIDIKESEVEKLEEKRDESLNNLHTEIKKMFPNFNEITQNDYDKSDFVLKIKQRGVEICEFVLPVTEYSETKKSYQVKNYLKFDKQIKKLRTEINNLKNQIDGKARQKIRASLTRKSLQNLDGGQETLNILKNIAIGTKQLTNK